MGVHTVGRCCCSSPNRSSTMAKLLIVGLFALIALACAMPVPEDAPEDHSDATTAVAAVGEKRDGGGGCCCCPCCECHDCYSDCQHHCFDHGCHCPCGGAGGAGTTGVAVDGVFHTVFGMLLPVYG